MKDMSKVKEFILDGHMENINIIKENFKMKDMSNVKEFVFGGNACYGKVRNYPNGNLAIQILDVNTHESLTVATTCLDDKLEPGKAYIKDYSENEGLLEVLLDAGIVTDVIGFEISGFMVVPLCRINVELLQ